MTSTTLLPTSWVPLPKDTATITLGSKAKVKVDEVTVRAFKALAEKRRRKSTPKDSKDESTEQR